MRNSLLATRRVFGTPLLCHPDKAAEIASVFVAPEHAGPDAYLMQRIADRAEMDPFPIIDGVAVITIEGTLVHRGAYVGVSSGVQSYDGVQTQIYRAMRSDNVRGVVFDMDSPGGEVSGVVETSRAMAALSKVKPTFAIVNDLAASAAYWIASHARQISVSESGCVGSIGALIMHVDISEALKSEGVNVTIVRGGEKKALGGPTEPLPDELFAEMQARVDATRDRFARDVGTARPQIGYEGALSTNADVYFGEDAVRRGLADVVAEPGDAFAAFHQALKDQGENYA